MYTITKNEQFNSIEISFDGKPSEAIREALKAMRFRWHGVKKVWYGYAEPDAVRVILDGEASETKKPKQSEKRIIEKAEPQNHIRIYYNGIKIDGGRLIRCGYSLNNNKDHAPSVSIHARDYADLPRDLLPVENNSDYYTDYFDSDHAYITPDHPLYKYFRYAALKDRAKDAARYIESLEKELQGVERWRGRFESVRRDIETQKKYLAEFEAETDPKQPTAADLEAVAQMRLEAENAKRAAEVKREQRERENALRMRNEGAKLIEETRAAYPLKGGEPVVLIHWSEHPAFYNYEDDELKLSVAAAEIILGTLDAEYNALRQMPDAVWSYYKTKFTITAENADDPENPLTYTGRYDLGDGDGGLIQHIRAFGERQRTHGEHGAEITNPEPTNDILQFAEYLASFTAAGSIKKALVHFGYISVAAFAQRVGLSEADAGRLLVEMYEEETAPEGGSTKGETAGA